jgi:hypothetical protein
MDGTKIFNFMAYNSGSEPADAGCYLVHVPKHGSIKAVCHKPLWQIPGSGIDPTTSRHLPAEFTVLVDIDGKRSAGPKFIFEKEAHIGRRLTSRDWVPLPMCSFCGKKQAYPGGGRCISCRADLGLL